LKIFFGNLATFLLPNFQDPLAHFVQALVSENPTATLDTKEVGIKAVGTVDLSFEMGGGGTGDDFSSGQIVSNVSHN
jgi:hypothetical protein